MSAPAPPFGTITAPRLSARLLSPVELKPVAALVSVALFLGGLIVLLFFWHIGFMPDADLASTTGIFFAAALVGLWSVIGSLLVGMLPGVVTTCLLQARRLPPHPSLIGVAPVLAFLFAAAIVFRRAVERDWLAEWQPLVWAVAALAVGAVGARLAARQRDRFVGPTVRERRPWLQDAGSFAFSALVWLIGMFQVLDIAVGLAKNNGQHVVWSVMLVLVWMVVLVVINTVSATLPLLVSGLYILLNLVPLLVLLTVLAGGPSALATYVLRQLGLAEIAHVDLVLEPAACRALAAVPSAGVHCIDIGGTGGGAMQDVRVRSRIGSQVLVERQSGSEGAYSSVATGSKEATRQVVLRKSDIVLWVRR